MKTVLRQTLAMRRRGLFWWSFGLSATIFFYNLFYPSVSGNHDINKVLESYPDELKAFLGEVGDITTAAGFLSAEVFSFLLPLLLLVFTLGFGSRSIAGEEEEHTLDLILATPLSRNGLLMARVLALLASGCILGVVCWGALSLSAAVVGMDISLLKLAAAVFLAILLAVSYGALALLIGAASGRRGFTLAVSASAAAAGYLVSSFGSVVSALEPWRPLSPFYYYSNHEPLRNGLHLSDATVLMAITLLFILLSLVAFTRRDLK